MSNVFVSIFSPVRFGEGDPASSRPPTAGDQRRRLGGLAIRNTPNSTCKLTAAQVGVCSLLNKDETRASWLRGHARPAEALAQVELARRELAQWAEPFQTLGSGSISPPVLR